MPQITISFWFNINQSFQNTRTIFAVSSDPTSNSVSAQLVNLTD